MISHSEALDIVSNAFGISAPLEFDRLGELVGFDEMRLRVALQNIANSIASRGFNPSPALFELNKNSTVSDAIDVIEDSTESTGPR
jgi:hypothetical protein